MTPLEELVQGASGDSVPVSTLLRKVKVVAARLGKVELEQWVDHELTGYPDDAELPDYRAARRAEVKGHFSGPAGSGLNYAVIPPSCFPEQMRNGYLFQTSFSQSMAELERLAQADKLLQAEWSGDAIALTNHLINTGEVRLYEYMGLQQAFRLISPNLVASLVDTVRTRILNLALSLESVVPSAGQKNAPISDAHKVDQIVMNLYGGSPNVAISSTHFQQQVTSFPGRGDRESLFNGLEALDLDPADIDSLRSAIHQDEEAGDGLPGSVIGVRVRSWAGELALKGASAAGTAAGTTAANLALKALAAYYGVPIP